MHRIFKHIIIATLLFVFIHLKSQQPDKYGVQLLVRPTPDSIMLRWAPVNYETWQAGMKNGYIIERYTLIRNGEFVNNGKPEILTPEPIIPYPFEK